MRWLAVDPGEMVGWSLWEDEALIESGQTPMEEFGDAVYIAKLAGGPARQEAALTRDAAFLQRVWLFQGVEQLVIEEFKIYPWKCAELGMDDVRTAQLIGALRMIARQANIPVDMQGATIKTQAVAGGAEELFVSPRHDNRHANDSIMHGVYWLAVTRHAHARDGRGARQE